MHVPDVHVNGGRGSEQKSHHIQPDGTHATTVLDSYHGENLESAPAKN